MSTNVPVSTSVLHVFPQVSRWKFIIQFLDIVDTHHTITNGIYFIGLFVQKKRSICNIRTVLAKSVGIITESKRFFQINCRLRTQTNFISFYEKMVFVHIWTITGDHGPLFCTLSCRTKQKFLIASKSSPIPILIYASVIRMVFKTNSDGT